MLPNSASIIMLPMPIGPTVWLLIQRDLAEALNMLSGAARLKAMQRMSEARHATIQRQKPGWLPILRFPKAFGGTLIVSMLASG